jgi:release factor glutamine methyltransferase
VRIVGQKCAALAITLLQQCNRGKVTVQGEQYTVRSDVFNPKLFITTTLLASALRITGEDSVLDMGTGSGFLAVAAAKRARKVVAVDINPAAVRCAEENARIHGVLGRVSVLQGDLFLPLQDGARFTVILFNPPYLDGPVQTTIDFAIRDPGKRVVGRFLKEAGGYLAPGGYILMAYSSIADPETVLELAGQSGFEYRVVKEKRLLLERFYVYKLFPKRKVSEP